MLKKLLFKVAMFGFVIFGLSMYAGYLTTGRLPSFVDGLRKFLPKPPAAGQPSWSGIGALEHQATARQENYEVLQSGKTVIYKWKNPNGTWNYSNTAPPPNVNAMRQEIVTPVAKVSTSEETTREDVQPAGAKSSEPVNPYSPGGAKELIDRAREIREQVEERGREQQSRLDRT